MMSFRNFRLIGNKCTDTQSEWHRQTEGYNKEKKPKKPTLLSMLVPQDSGYLHYPLDMEGVTHVTLDVEGSLLPARTR